MKLSLQNETIGTFNLKKTGLIEALTGAVAKRNLGFVLRSIVCC